MKKITKFLVAALALAMLLGTVFAVSASAADETPADSTPWVIAKNVSYSENIHLLLAIDAKKVDEESLLAVKISDAAGNVSETFFGVEYNADLYGESDEGAVAAYVIHTLGVAAKDMADDLTIQIYYDGDLVETTNYSVAEYFYERLYKDGVALATEGQAFNQKSLYLASLTYGSAAQKLLSPADALYLEDSIYVGGVDSVPAIFNPDNTLTLPKGIYSVKSYVDGALVESVVEGGDFFITNPAYITEFDVVPEGALDFETAEVGDAYANGSGNEIVAIGAGKQGGATVEKAVATENGNTYLHYAKTAKTSDSSMSWINFKKLVATEDQIVFQADIRYTKIAGSSAHFRFYTGRDVSSSDASGGTELTSSSKGRIAVKATSGGNLSIAGKDTGVAAGEWCTLRMILKNGSVDIYVTGANGGVNYLTTVTAEVDYAAADVIQYTHQASDCSVFDVDNVYYGTTAPSSLTVNSATEPYTLKNESSSAITYSLTNVKNILNNDVRYVIDKETNGGQVVLRYNRNQLYTGTEHNTTIVKMRVMIDNISPSIIWKSSEIDFSFGAENGGTRVYRCYITQSNSKELIFQNGPSGKKEAGVSFGEWFDVMLVYSAEGDAYDATKYRLAAYINGVLFNETTTQWSASAYAAGCDIGRFSVLMNGDVTARLCIEGLSITTTYIPFASDEVAE